MKKKTELQKMIREIDHKGYGNYKILKGEYDFSSYYLCIDHVQGDPFASPSRVRLVIPNQGKVPKEFFSYRWRKTAVEDFLLRLVAGKLRESDRGRMGSGKSGLIGICRTGQEVLERTALLVSEKNIEVRLEIGFPAFGRSIAGEQLEILLYKKLPELVESTFGDPYKYREQMTKFVGMSDNQEYIRRQLKEKGLVCFVANGSVLPRESGISERPMKNAVPFSSPESLEVSMEILFTKEMKTLPDWEKKDGVKKRIMGMGISRGITLIVGGGYHGKSTLLKAIERGVYPHIPGDGREYVITDDSAVKLRAEEGRFIYKENISNFISNLPNKTDTGCFSTENASGSTSQAANTMEAIAAGSRLFLIDEDTTATNFMVRDERMAKLVSQEKEPIRPFLYHIEHLYKEQDISTILVVGSSGDFFEVADTVIQMDEYHARNVTEEAKKLAAGFEGKAEAEGHFAGMTDKDILLFCPPKKEIGKLKVHDWDELVLDHSEIDLRYLEQIADGGQTIAIGYLFQYALSVIADGKKNPVEITDELYRQIGKQGFLSMVPKNYPAGSPVLPRKYEFLACLLRYREISAPGKKEEHVSNFARRRR